MVTQMVLVVVIRAATATHRTKKLPRNKSKRTFPLFLTLFLPFTRFVVKGIYCLDLCQSLVIRRDIPGSVKIP